MIYFILGFIVFMIINLTITVCIRKWGYYDYD
jgi:hypothetical protein